MGQECGGGEAEEARAGAEFEDPWGVDGGLVMCLGVGWTWRAFRE